MEEPVDANVDAESLFGGELTLVATPVDLGTRVKSASAFDLREFSFI